MLVSGQCSLNCILWIVSTVENLPSIGNHRSRMGPSQPQEWPQGLPGRNPWTTVTSLRHLTRQYPPGGKVNTIRGPVRHRLRQSLLMTGPHFSDEPLNRLKHAPAGVLYIDVHSNCACTRCAWPNSLDDSGETSIIGHEKVRFDQIRRQLRIDRITNSYPNEVLCEVHRPTQPSRQAGVSKQKGAALTMPFSPCWISAAACVGDASLPIRSPTGQPGGVLPG